MAGTGRHPRSDAPIVTHAEVEASLRRQFVVPVMGVLPSAMVASGVSTAAASQGSSWMSDALRIDFRLTGSLRQAAGLLLAASLWTGAGYLFFQHMEPARVVSAPRGIPYVNPDPTMPLGYLFTEYLDDSSQTVAESTALPVDRQDRLWKQLSEELADRRGEEVLPHLEQLRNGEMVIELLSVDGETFSNRKLLLVSARVEGVVSVALIEPTTAHVPQQQTGGYVASPETMPLIGPQLFLSQFPGGYAYETVLGDRPVLLPALLPDSRMQSALPLRRMRKGNRFTPIMAPPAYDDTYLNNPA